MTLPEHDYARFGSLLSQIRLSSVIRLSVTSVHPIQRVGTFRQYFFTAVYLGHPLTTVHNFTEIVGGNPNVEGVKPKSGSWWIGLS